MNTHRALLLAQLPTIMLNITFVQSLVIDISCTSKFTGRFLLTNISVSLGLRHFSLDFPVILGLFVVSFVQHLVSHCVNHRMSIRILRILRSAKIHEYLLISKLPTNIIFHYFKHLRKIFFAKTTQ